MSSCSHPLEPCSFSLTGIIKSSYWIDEANIWRHISPTRWNKRTAAEINWLGFSRAAMPQCRGGMLMSLFLLISAPQTRRVGLLSFHCFIPKIFSLSYRLSDLKGDFACFTPFEFKTMWHKNLYHSIFSRWPLKKWELDKHFFFDQMFWHSNWRRSLATLDGIGGHIHFFRNCRPVHQHFSNKYEKKGCGILVESFSKNTAFTISTSTPVYDDSTWKKPWFMLKAELT